MRLYKHQRKALRKLMKNNHYFLFMDMGTGKTPPTIKSIERRYERGEVNRVIIFVPNSIVFNWEEELANWLTIPYTVETLNYRKKDKRKEVLVKTLKKDHSLLTLTELKKLGHRGTKKSILEQYKPPLLILLLNYEKARILFKELRKFKPQMLIIDELHNLRNRGAEKSKKIYSLSQKCSFRVGLTGTPICKGYEDLFMPYKVIDESILGDSYPHFEGEYIVKGGYMNHEIVGYKKEKKLKRILRDTSYRVLLDDCIDIPPMLPPRYIFCELGTKARKAYNEMNNEMLVELEMMKENISREELKQVCREQGIYFNPRASYLDLFLRASEYLNSSSCELTITKILRLHQIAGGFITMDSGKVVNIGKEKLELVKNFVEGYQEPLIIFCQFIPEIKMLKEELDKLQKVSIEGGAKVKRKLKVETFMGKTKNKGQIYKDFRQGRVDVLICQISTGSVGLNLQRARKAIFYSWNTRFDEYVQAIARIRRNGQKHKVEIIYLVATDTRDLETLKILQERKSRNQKAFKS